MNSACSFESPMIVFLLTPSLPACLCQCLASQDLPGRGICASFTLCTLTFGLGVDSLKMFLVGIPGGHLATVGREQSSLETSYGMQDSPLYRS